MAIKKLIVRYKLGSGEEKNRMAKKSQNCWIKAFKYFYWFVIKFLFLSFFKNPVMETNVRAFNFNFNFKIVVILFFVRLYSF